MSLFFFLSFFLFFFWGGGYFSSTHGLVFLCFLSVLLLSFFFCSFSSIPLFSPFILFLHVFLFLPLSCHCFTFFHSYFVISSFHLFYLSYEPRSCLYCIPFFFIRLALFTFLHLVFFLLILSFCIFFSFLFLFLLFILAFFSCFFFFVGFSSVFLSFFCFLLTQFQTNHIMWSMD